MRLTVIETLELHDITDVVELALDSIVPACCSEGCTTEPDGCCEHGHPSILIEMGVI